MYAIRSYYDVVEVDVHRAQKRWMRGENDALARDFVARIAERNLDSVLPRKAQLRAAVLARTCILRLLYDDDSVIRQLLRERDRRRITSYNVCYTKLLRSRTLRAVQHLARDHRDVTKVHALCALNGGGFRNLPLRWEAERLV